MVKLHADGRSPASLYVGVLRHQRFEPVSHQFRFPLFMVLLDVDRLEEAMAVSPFTSYNRWNWASFYDADHLGDPRYPLRARLAADAAANGLTLPSGPIRLLTHLRYFGYCFNPVSFFYCYDDDGQLALVLAEVTNTFGGSHNYWLLPDRSACGSSATAMLFRSAARKSLYVSPFIEQDMSYDFTFTPPEAQIVAHMTVTARAAALPMFKATLTLTARPWTSTSLGGALLRHPCMTAAVIAGIHWQALRLWWKGVTVVPNTRATGIEL